MEFKVNVGDSKDYEVLKYYSTEPEDSPKRRFSYTEFEEDDGSTVSITVQKGTPFSVEVTNISESEIYGKITLDGHTLIERLITYAYLSISTDARFVMKTTANTTHWEQEAVDWTDDSDPNDWSRAWLDGDIFYLEVFSKHLDNSIDHDKFGVNWKTGWIEYYYDKSALSDESVVYEMEWKAVGLVVSTTGEEDSPGFGILPLLATLLVAAEAARRYSHR
ncbi:MAG: hypothetical protein ACFFB3_06790 [Candidatus Hodarchaeota archaeon]